MKKILLLFLSLLLQLSSIEAQDEKAIFIYRNDNTFNAFFNSEVDSITYSNTDLNGVEHETTVTQIIWTNDSVFRIPLAVIDSVSFCKPQTVYRDNVKANITELFDYFIEEEDGCLLFNKNTPSNLYPNTGDVLILREGEHNLFPEGFVGKVKNFNIDSGNIKIEYEGITGLSDIFEQYVNIEKIRVPTSNQTQSRAATATDITDWNSEYIEISMNSPESNNVQGSIYGSLEGKWQVIVESCIINGKEINTLRANHTWQLGIGVKVKASKTFSIPSKPKHIRIARVPIFNGVFFFELYWSPLIQGEGNIEIDANFKTPTFGGRHNVIFGGGKYSLGENSPIETESGNNQATFSSTLSLSGELKLGGELDFSLRPVGSREWIKVGVNAFIGPKITGNVELLTSNQNEDYYDIHKDDKLRLSLFDMDIQAYWKSYFLGDERRNIGAKATFSTPGFDRYFFPLFSKPEITIVESNKNVNVMCKPLRDMIFPRTLGFGLYDNNNRLLEEKYENNSYFNNDTERYMMQTFSSLERGVKYSVRPLIKVLTGVVPASPSTDIIIEPNVETGITLSTSHSSAVVRGYVEGIENSNSPYVLGFRYNKSGNPNETNSNLATSPMRNDGLYEVELPDLEPKTKYYYRAYLSIDGKQYYGKVLDFTTKEIPVPEPSPITGGHFNESVTSATIECTYSSVTAEVECGYYLNGASVSLGNVSGKQTIPLTGLEPNTEYEYNAFVIFQGQTKTGIPNSFKTLSPLPTTGRHYNEALTSATIECLYANVPNGAECGVELVKDTEGEFTANIINIPLGYVTGDQIIPLSNLEPDTKYFYQAYIKYNGRTYYNPDPNDEKDFVTLKPLATTGECLSSTSTSAVVNVIYANVPKGASCRINYYSKTEDLLNQGYKARALFYQGYKDLGEVSGSHDVLLDNLLPETEYYYYAYIIYNGNTYDGLERSFSTKTPEAWVDEVEDKESDITCTSILNIPYGFSNVPEDKSCHIAIYADGEENYHYDDVENTNNGIYPGFENLLPDTQYYYFTFIGDDQWRSNIVSFNTKAPSATLIDITEIQERQATIIFSMTSIPEEATTYIQLIDGNGNELFYETSVSQTELAVGSLTPSTNYTATLIIEYAERQWKSNSLQFTTKTPPTPVATTGDYSNVTMTSATVTCTYENVPEGGVCGVEYTWNGGSTKQTVGSSNGTQSVTLSGLQPATSYTYCAYIEANGQTYYGSDKSFTTDSPSLAGTWNCTITKGTSTESWRITLTEDHKGSAVKTDGSSNTFEASWGVGADGKASVGFGYVISTSSYYSYQTYNLNGQVDNLMSPSQIQGEGWYEIGNAIAETVVPLTFNMSK